MNRPFEQHGGDGFERNALRSRLAG